jgi:hypothetical protein
MTTLQQILAAALDLPNEEQEALVIAIRSHKSEIRRTELAEYARQAALDVRSGKLKPKSVASHLAPIHKN